jgi:hypothetical protein
MAFRDGACFMEIVKLKINDWIVPSHFSENPEY